jgi:hypothetical protein
MVTRRDPREEPESLPPPSSRANTRELETSRQQIVSRARDPREELDSDAPYPYQQAVVDPREEPLSDPPLPAIATRTPAAKAPVREAPESDPPLPAIVAPKARVAVPPAREESDSDPPLPAIPASRPRPGRSATPSTAHAPPPRIEPKSIPVQEIGHLAVSTPPSFDDSPLPSPAAPPTGDHTPIAKRSSGKHANADDAFSGSRRSPSGRMLIHIGADPRLRDVEPLIRATDWAAIEQKLAPTEDSPKLSPGLSLIYALARREVRGDSVAESTTEQTIRAVADLFGVEPSSPIALVIGKRLIRRNPGLRATPAPPPRVSITLSVLAIVIGGLIGWLVANNKLGFLRLPHR